MEGEPIAAGEGGREGASSRAWRRTTASPSCSFADAVTLAAGLHHGPRGDRRRHRRSGGAGQHRALRGDRRGGAARSATSHCEPPRRHPAQRRRAGRRQAHDARASRRWPRRRGVGVPVLHDRRRAQTSTATYLQQLADGHEGPLPRGAEPGDLDGALRRHRRAAAQPVRRDVRRVGRRAARRSRPITVTVRSSGGARATATATFSPAPDFAAADRVTSRASTAGETLDAAARRSRSAAARDGDRARRVLRRWRERLRDRRTRRSPSPTTRATSATATHTLQGRACHRRRTRSSQLR